MHRYHTKQVGAKLWYVYEDDRIIAEAFTEVDANTLVRALAECVNAYAIAQRLQNPCGA